MKNIITLENVCKTYSNKLLALKNINLNIEEGEIFALLGPNGAGKSTLINIICGLSYHTSGKIYINGIDIKKNRKLTKAIIGLVPQELHLESFETVYDNVCYSRGLWGKESSPTFINSILKKLKLFDKKENLLMQLSGGMKRRVLIAKALSHKPKILFLDEPSAGVDVELRQEMWEIIYTLKKEGVTIILTTHYIDEAEEIADRVGFINKGKIVLVENKNVLLRNLGNKKIVLTLKNKILKVPSFLSAFKTKISHHGFKLEILIEKDRSQITKLMKMIESNNLFFKDFDIKKRSLESIFVDYIRKK